jgi:hypothetical protein
MLARSRKSGHQTILISQIQLLSLIRVLLVLILLVLGRMQC